jgi:hypothetical protein
VFWRLLLYSPRNHPQSGGDHQRYGGAISQEAAATHQKSLAKVFFPILARRYDRSYAVGIVRTVSADLRDQPNSPDSRQGHRL